MNKKPASFRHYHAFTLVELLTVIVIIAVLMGLLFPVVSASIENTRRAKAGTVVKNIVNACKMYHTDYGMYPPIADALVETGGGGSGGSSGGGAAAQKEAYYAYGDVDNSGDKAKVNNNQLFDVLRAIARGENEDHKLNKRQQKYFEEKKAKDPKEGQTRDGFADGPEFKGGGKGDRAGRLYDPWGLEYFIVLDADGDEELDLSEFWEDLKTGSDENSDKIRVPVAAFSLAKDGKFGGKGYENKLKKENSTEAPDDVLSWQ